MDNLRHIWIIGASSGIGRALAVELDKQGARLILSARREGVLQDLNNELGGKHTVLPLDVTQPDQIQNALEKIDKLDSMIFMSGTYEPLDIAELTIEATNKMVGVNLLGPIYAVHHVLPFFKAQKSGQIVLCASVSGYAGLPSGQPYSATKAGLINFAETLRVEAAPHNIDVKVINTGFVKTPMTDKNDFDMPMRITAEAAAKKIARGLRKRGFEIHTPKSFTYLTKLIASLPYWLFFSVTKNFQKK